jgi:TatD DNase family protein
MRLVDSHCHLHDDRIYPQLPAVLSAAHDAGIAACVTAAAEPSEWPRIRDIAQDHSPVAFALGIHPWYAAEEHLALMPELAKASTQGACAIGEIGLDAKIESPAFDAQERLFEAQLAVAREAGLPVVLHCRGAFNSLLHCIRRVGLSEAGGMIHAFSGSVEIAEECLAFGLRISMGSALTYRNSKKRARVLERVFPDHFLLETDSPDMPPVSLRGKTNVPANILLNLQAAAETLGVAATTLPKWNGTQGRKDVSAEAAKPVPYRRG